MRPRIRQRADSTAMNIKADIVANWLPRYTGTPLEGFGKYILLVNFSNYVRMFAAWHKVPVRGEDRPMLNATCNGITIINFGMGSASAATIMDLLSAVQPKACLLYTSPSPRDGLLSRMPSSA